jgi:GTP-binding protein HflX
MIETPRALLVSIRTPKVTDAEAEGSLVELERLVTTLGFKVIGVESQRQPTTAGVTVVGEGKLKELARFTGGKGYLERGKKLSIEAVPGKFPPSPSDELATVVVFDCDLSPSQVRNVETALGIQVLDRTGVIIEIFSRHAETRTAQLQVEIARQTYLAPRLREMGVGKERHAGRGSGESGLEMERRKIRDRLADLKHELQTVQREEESRRSQRSEQLCVALVGYTNAGKSSLMRALTGSDVLVEDKLFATLDTTVRALQPETQPRILVSDTVGFIHKLPHDLVASFRSTLDEARNALLILYVVDAFDRSFRSQLEVVRDVLREIGCEKTPHLLLLNKSDCLSEEQKQSLKQEFSDSILISTRSPEDIKSLRERMIDFFEKDMIEEEILVPYSAQGALGEARSNMRTLKENFEEDGIRLLVRSRPIDLQRLKKMMG